MIQRRRGLRLSNKTSELVSVRAEFVAQKLDRDLPVKLGVLGKVHLAHTACTDLGKNAVVEQILARPDLYCHLRDLRSVQRVDPCSPAGRAAEGCSVISYFRIESDEV